MSCLGGTPDLVQVHKGQGKTKDDYTVNVEKPNFGNLNGEPAAVVTITCTGANGLPSSVLVYTSSPEGPMYLGQAMSSAEGWYVQSAAIQDGGLLIDALGIGNGSHVYPELQLTSGWLIKGGHLTEVAHTVDKNPNYTQVSTPGTRNQFGCTQAQYIAGQIAKNQRYIQSLSGGSIAGVPQYSERSLYLNINAYTAATADNTRLQQALAQARRACAATN